MKTALVFGATGLVGKNLVDSLNERVDIELIKVFTRKEVLFNSNKIQYNKFDSSELPEKKLFGDELYLCLGTTIRKAGNVKNFQAIDLILPLKIAKICKNNNVNRLAIISSIGANWKSKNYYLKTKGELEKKMENLNFKHLLILRPSILLGKRSEFRFGESIMQSFIQIFGPLFKGKYTKYRGIKAEKVAGVLANKLPKINGVHKLESDEIKI